MKENDKEITKALGRKSRQLRNENMTRVLLTIAKEPLSFSELLKKTKLSRPVLTNHLRRLERNHAIYRDTIKPNQTLNPDEIGKIVYKAGIDQVPEILRTTLSLIDILSGTLGDMKLDKKLREHKKAIITAIVDYLNEHIRTREKALELELKGLGVKTNG